MKTTSISGIKKELQSMEVEDVLDICLRLIKFKKDNKELVHYLLFESNNEGGYIRQSKQDIDKAFAQTNSSSFYLAKKSIRRALRLTDKYIKLSGKPETELELLLFFCTCMQNTSINWKQSKVLLNIYQRVLARMEKSYALLHEDLQFEYRESLNRLKVFSA